MSRHSPRLTYANVVSTAALFAALGGGAYAAAGGIPDAGGVFHGCVNKGSGGLRVVKSARSCRSVKKRKGKIVFPGEIAIAWNKHGTPGTPGATKVIARSATNNTGTNVTSVDCNPGEVATGGGGEVSEGANLDSSHPTPANAGTTPTGWSVNSNPGVANPGDLTAWVICASP